MRSLKTGIVLAALALSPIIGWAEIATTRPVALKPTAEQKKIIETAGREAADAPAPKIDVKIATADGAPNPNFGQVNAGFMMRHEQFMKRRSQPMDLLFIGDSITDGWRKVPEIWNANYGKYNAANFGISGDRLQHVLWRIEQGELDGIAPKVVVLMIGTNNSRWHSAEEIAGGITKIVEEIHARLPQTKVLLLGVFPRAEQSSDPFRDKLKKVNAIISQLDDGKKTRYLEIWQPFLNADGSMQRELMPDLLHPNAKGYEVWAKEMQPLLDEMMK